jgi:6-phosphogluconate dehydrogenase (decarboxylating)
VIERLAEVLRPDDIVIGGGNVKFLDELPSGCRAGDNRNALIGGFLLWK